METLGPIKGIYRVILGVFFLHLYPSAQELLASLNWNAVLTKALWRELLFSTSRSEPGDPGGRVWEGGGGGAIFLFSALAWRSWVLSWGALGACGDLAGSGRDLGGCFFAGGFGQEGCSSFHGP